jgi:uracil phosphoribosyltransferase
MYRHLAHWTGYLALAWAMIAPLDTDGSLEQAIADAVAKARVRAARVATQLYVPAERVSPATRATIRSAVEPFTGDVIAKMVVICAVLRAATGPA